MKKLNRLFTLCAVILAPKSLLALDYDITEHTDGGGGAFSDLTDFIQSFISFIDGPVALLVSVVSVIIFCALYALNPREGNLGLAGRVAVSSIVILNVTTWIGAFVS